MMDGDRHDGCLSHQITRPSQGQHLLVKDKRLPVHELSILRVFEVVKGNYNTNTMKINRRK